MVRRTELALFQAIEAGDDSARFELGERLKRCAHWVVSNRLGGSQALWGEIDEIADEATVRLEQLRRRGFVGGATEFKTYVYKVVASVCIEAWRRRRWLDSLDTPVTLADGEEKPLGDVVQAMVDDALPSDAALESSEHGQRIRAALGQLDERCRRVLEDFHAEHIPIVEMARRERVRANTIEVALTRCRRRLYAAFLAQYVDARDERWRDDVEDIGRKLPGQLGEVFTAWWVRRRSVAEISRETGIVAAETRRLLGLAKRDVWHTLEERPQS